jgi:hypothetical protein
MGLTSWTEMELFQWNNKVDELLEGIIKENVVLYPSLAAEILGFVLD